MIHFISRGVFFVDFLKFSDPVLYFGYGDSITNFDRIALANLLEFLRRQLPNVFLHYIL